MTYKKEIGGFFELELNKYRQYHDSAIKLNSARYCLQYLFKAKKYKKIFIPYYICDSVLHPILKEKLEYEFYNINSKFEPIFNQKIKKDECFLYANFFGINSQNVNNIVSKFKNIIIDNTQAFFEMPLNGIDTIYSPRKFFGVSDGGYLYTDKKININLEKDTSYERCNYMLKRIDLSANQSYNLFKENEQFINNHSMKKMSKITEAILSNIDYKKIKKIRNKNFIYLHQHLYKYNKLNINLKYLNGPMVYPLLIFNHELKESLINKKIYIPTYWKEVYHRVNIDSTEFKLVSNLIALPIDQRYDINDMKYILHNIKCNLDR